MYLVNDNNEVHDDFFLEFKCGVLYTTDMSRNMQYMQYVLDLQIYLELILNC